jgi:hypothetical protein
MEQPLQRLISYSKFSKSNARVAAARSGLVLKKLPISSPNGPTLMTLRGWTPNGTTLRATSKPLQQNTPKISF